MYLNRKSTTMTTFLLPRPLLLSFFYASLTGLINLANLPNLNPTSPRALAQMVASELARALRRWVQYIEVHN